MPDPTEFEEFIDQGLEWPDENLELDAPQRKGFQIEDDEHAERVLRRLDRWQREADRIARMAADERAKIDAFVAANLGTKDDPKGAAREVAFYGGALTDYYRRRADADDSTPQTLRLPTGTIGRRKNPDTVEVDDPGAFVEWALEHDRADLISEVVPVGKAELKKALTPQTDPKDAERGAILHFVDEDGAAIPGVKLHVGEDRYEAKVAPAERTP